MWTESCTRLLRKQYRNTIDNGVDPGTGGTAEGRTVS